MQRLKLSHTASCCQLFEKQVKLLNCCNYLHFYCLDLPSKKKKTKLTSGIDDAIQAHGCYTHRRALN